MTEKHERVFVAVYVPKEIEISLTSFTGIEGLLKEFASKLEQLLEVAWVRSTDDKRIVHVKASFIFLDPIVLVRGSTKGDK